MRTKSAITCSLVLPLVLLGLLKAAPLAMAGEWTDHSGTICKNYSAGDVAYIEYSTSGTRSVKNSATAILCPLTRNTTGTYGAFFYVLVTHTGTQTTSCSAWSRDAYGSLIAVNGDNWTGSGSGVIGLNLYGADNSSTLSNYSVWCLIPGNGNGVLNTIDFYEF